LKKIAIFLQVWIILKQLLFLKFLSIECFCVTGFTRQTALASYYIEMVGPGLDLGAGDPGDGLR